jgi:hypothetical protein
MQYIERPELPRLFAAQTFCAGAGDFDLAGLRLGMCPLFP